MVNILHDHYSNRDRTTDNIFCTKGTLCSDCPDLGIVFRHQNEGIITRHLNFFLYFFVFLLRYKMPRQSLKIFVILFKIKRWTLLRIVKFSRLNSPTSRSSIKIIILLPFHSTCIYGMHSALYVQ